MVFQDISAPVELNKVGRPKSAAQMLDRFFSFVIDYIIISPFVMFSLYILLSDGFQFWRTNPLAPENEIFVLIVGLSYVLIFSLIQTYFVSIWSATPGQHFLKIRFEFEENEPGRLVKIYIRQILFWVSMLFLGIPYLAVLADKKRRTFYDKVSGVNVVSLKSENVLVGFENEYKYWQAFMATLSLFFGFVLAAFIFQNYDRLVGRVVSFNEFKARNFFCEEMAGIAIEKRLETAVALNLIDQLSDSCLDREADFVLWRQRNVDTSLAYYAKSLTTDSKEKEQSYLSQSCEGQDISNSTELSVGCRIASAFKEKKIQNLIADLEPGSILNDVIKYELTKMFQDSEANGEKFKRLEAYNDLKGIKKYRLNEYLSEFLKSEKKPDQIDSESIALTALRVRELDSLKYDSIENRKLILTELGENESATDSVAYNSDSSKVENTRRPASMPNQESKNTDEAKRSVNVEELLELVDQL